MITNKWKVMNWNSQTETERGGSPCEEMQNKQHYKKVHNKRGVKKPITDGSMS